MSGRLSHSITGFLRVCGYFVVLCFVCAGTLAAPSTAAAPSILTLSASSGSFIANWDEDSSSTAIAYSTTQRSRVSVSIQSRQGTLLRVLQRRQLQPAGAHKVWWDGRTATGAVVEPGSYTAVVRVLPANVGTTPLAIAHSSVNVEARPLSVDNLSISRGMVAAAKGRNISRMSLRMSRSGSLAVVIVNARGHVVRNLVSGPRNAGTASFAWTGHDDAGKRVADGHYTLLAAGTTGWFPTNTIEAPLRLDATTPTISGLAKVLVASNSSGSLSVRLPYVASEAGTFTVFARTGRRHSTYSVKTSAGKHTLKLAGSVLGIAPRSRRTRYTTILKLGDEAGNVTAGRIVIEVPARLQAPPPTPAPPKPTPPPSGGTTFIWPAHGTLTSGFGPRGNRFHYGIDIANSTGTPIYAVASGMVSFTGTQSGYGNVVTISHPGSGATTLYAHQSRIAAYVGQIVTRGQLIGYIGSTGNSTGPHLHFEFQVGGIAKNPIPYLPAGGLQP